MKQFISEIPPFGIQIQSFYFFFSGSSQTADSYSQEKTLGIWCWKFNFLRAKSWDFCWLVIRRIQILSWILSIFSKMSSETYSLRISCGAQPLFLWRSTYTWFLYNFYSVSLGRSSLTESITRFLTRLNVPALAEWEWKLSGKLATGRVWKLFGKLDTGPPN